MAFVDSMARVTAIEAGRRIVDRDAASSPAAIRHAEPGKPPPVCFHASRIAAFNPSAILNSVPIESRGSCISWSAWYGRTGIRQPAGPALTFDRLSMKIAAAADGLGVVLESTSLAERELADGRLIKMNGIQDGVILRESHFVSVRKRDMDTWKINAFVQWIKSEWALSRPGSNGEHA
ncbi:LysR substrate-binding domain-containing protein [Burkholderia sp. Ac-20379]|uniref:LysR substrate-binding domain-containing protein n=1 Tax=Burkholderia sp. Ac-20379 TaxID=2703900 RepID=UPI001980D2D3|nr:LysR substrate-binding domain-containing protein [Burkholderia sp. Ac-20379]MBN3727948.1 hypothetical protein [Burkholderia sp. Ac-20379]